jgi:hypothetical protein
MLLFVAVVCVGVGEASDDGCVRDEGFGRKMDASS